MAAKLIDVTAQGRQHIGRYELVAELATGGMATVYLARLSGVGGFQRFVAVKRLHPHLASEEGFVQMFLDEARLAAGIHHPNVVPILEVDASKAGYYLVMEYIEGDTLARLLARAASKGSALPIGIGLRVILDMLAGLHAAHELRDERGAPTELVHRDVSPQNILVGMDGISRITDFGVARAATRLSERTGAGQLKGKAAYMAPEQATSRAVDRRADVFAAGIVLWEVLASRRLFRAENEAATITRVLHEPIEDPARYATAVSPEVAAVCLQALNREVGARFADCAQFADALERATVDGPPGSRIATPREVAAYVADVIGNEISEQREAVRAWLAISEPSQVGGARSRPNQPLPEPSPAFAPNKTSVALRVRRHWWWGLGALVLFVLAVGFARCGRDGEGVLPSGSASLLGSEGDAGGSVRESLPSARGGSRVDAPPSAVRAGGSAQPPGVLGRAVRKTKRPGTTTKKKEDEEFLVDPYR